MKSNIENDIKFKIRILFFLILLQFLLFFVQPFIIIYLLQHWNIRMASLVTEESNMKTGKNNDENAIINENTIGHQAKKREISSETEKDCQGNFSLTPNPSEINDDTIMIKENWSVKKADLLEYCFTANDFCQKNKHNSKDEQKSNFGDEKQQENKNCILQNITDYDAFQYSEYNSRLGVKHAWRTANVEVGPEGNIKITANKQFSRYIQEFQVNEKGEVKILREFEYPKEILEFRVIEYNGNIYGEHRNKSEKRFVKYNIETGKLTFGDKFDFDESGYSLNLFHGDNCFWAVKLINVTKKSRKCYDKHFIAYKIDLDNLKVLSMLNFTFIIEDKFQVHCWSTDMFIAHDKLYGVTYLDFKVYIMSASTNKEFVYFDVKSHNEDVLYIPKEQNFYFRSANEQRNNEILVKKLHFNCSNED